MAGQGPTVQARLSAFRQRQLDLVLTAFLITVRYPSTLYLFLGHVGVFAPSVGVTFILQELVTLYVGYVIGEVLFADVRTDG